MRAVALCLTLFLLISCTSASPSPAVLPPPSPAPVTRLPADDLPVPVAVPEPTASVIIAQANTPAIYVMLSERLGISLALITTLPVEELARLIEQHGALSGLTAGEEEAHAARTSIDRAVAFLHVQYNPSVRLLRESPVVAPGRHWLATDNQLAVYALVAAGDPLAAKITQTLAENGERFDAGRHGVIEALAGVAIAWPPRTHAQRELLPGIWHEERVSGAPMLDWANYADLALYGALEAWNRGDAATAHNRYVTALARFDGTGFDDAATDTHYTTYKLALALLVAQRLQEPLRHDLLAALLAKQDATGGFVALYNRQGVPEGDANTETTAYAVLALIGQR